MMEKRLGNICVDDGGTGSVPVVIIHSLAGNTRQWTAQLDHIRKTRRAIAIDLRGHGQSLPPADGDYSFSSMIQDIEMVLDQLGVQRCILAGHSMGGSVAGLFAGTYPERVAGLLLVDPADDATGMPAEDVQQYLGAMESEAYTSFMDGYWGQILSGATEETTTTVMQDLHDTSKETVVGMFKELFGYSPIPALERYDGPKLSVITAQNEMPYSLHNIVTDLKYVAVSGTGHWLQMDKPEEFNQILDDFLGSVSD